MSVILKLRMLSDEDDCFLRDYEVPYESTLEELHDFICNDLQYEKIPESSFFEPTASGTDDANTRMPMPARRDRTLPPPGAGCPKTGSRTSCTGCTTG